MPTATYTPLATTTLSSSASTVTFSNIPTTGFRDLVLAISLASSNTSAIFIGFNGNSYTSNTVYNRIVGTGSGTSPAAASQGIIGWSPQNGTSGSVITHFIDFSSTDKDKVWLSRSNGASWVTAVAGRWASTSAITSFTLTAETANFASGSTFSLFGIAS